ncbi:MAG: glutamate mutase L, partial [Rhodospirillales bacterium]
MQEGKDLGGVKTVIGTGGALAHGSDPAAIISSALADAAKPLSLRPTSAALILDADYLLYAVGLLAAVEPEAALKLGLDNLNPLDTKEAKDGCNSAA